MTILTKKERLEKEIITTTSSRQNGPMEKWTPWSSLQLLCRSGEEGGWRTGHILQEAKEHFIVLQRVSVKKEWPPYGIPAPLASIVRYSNVPLLCSVKVMWGYTHHSRKSCQPALFRFDIALPHPHAQLYLFLLKSFNYCSSILAALSVERYIPLLE